MQQQPPEAEEEREEAPPPTDSSSPSFRMDSPGRISAAPDCHHNGIDGDHEDDDDDFEFSFVRIPEAGSAPSPADDVFSNGMICPVYPVFNRHLLFTGAEHHHPNYYNNNTRFNSPSLNSRSWPENSGRDPAEQKADEEKAAKPTRLPLRRLFIEEEKEFSSTSSSSSLSSSVDDLDGVAPGTYCVWNPNNNSKKDRRKKSSSTGSLMSPSLRWRLRDLVVGRSHSDGKDKFVFFPVKIQEEDQEAKSSTVIKEKQLSSSSTSIPGGGGGKKSSGKPAAAEQMGKQGQGGPQRQKEVAAGPSSSSRRRSFLPYKPDLVGFMAGGVNGFSSSNHHAF